MQLEKSTLAMIIFQAVLLKFFFSIVVYGNVSKEHNYLFFLPQKKIFALRITIYTVAELGLYLSGSTFKEGNFN